MMVDQKQQVNRQQKMEKQSNSEHTVYLVLIQQRLEWYSLNQSRKVPLFIPLSIRQFACWLKGGYLNKGCLSRKNMRPISEEK